MRSRVPCGVLRVPRRSVGRTRCGDAPLGGAGQRRSIVESSDEHCGSAFEGMNVFVHYYWRAGCHSWKFQTSTHFPQHGATNRITPYSKVQLFQPATPHDDFELRQLVCLHGQVVAERQCNAVYGDWRRYCTKHRFNCNGSE